MIKRTLDTILSPCFLIFIINLIGSIGLTCTNPHYFSGYTPNACQSAVWISLHHRPRQTATTDTLLLLLHRNALGDNYAITWLSSPSSYQLV